MRGAGSYGELKNAAVRDHPGRATAGEGVEQDLDRNGQRTSGHVTGLLKQGPEQASSQQFEPLLSVQTRVWL